MKKLNFDYLILNINFGVLVENFGISAVASILIIRVFLYLTGYPQLGNSQLHIAHMLWGGFLMMTAVILLLALLNKEAKLAASIVGGIGFGVFIDELGKFITQDNNYFFQPTIALIYIIFIILFLIARLIERKIHLSDKEYAVNALEVTKEVVLLDLDLQEKNKALFLLAKSDSKNPAVKALKKMLEKISAKEIPHPNLVIRIRHLLNDLYLRIIKNKKFSKTIVMFFILASVVNFVKAILNIKGANTFFEWGQLLSSLLSGAFVLAGIYFIRRRSRLKAYDMFKLSVLVSIFLTQFFLFYIEQLSVLTGLIINLAIFNFLQYLINQEETIKKSPKENTLKSLKLDLKLLSIKN